MGVEFDLRNRVRDVALTECCGSGRVEALAASPRALRATLITLEARDALSLTESSSECEGDWLSAALFGFEVGVIFFFAVTRKGWPRRHGGHSEGAP